MDKVVYANEILVLRIVCDSASKVYWTSTAVDDPTTAAASGTTVNISSLQLEQDPLIIQGLRQQVASGGFSMLIPYIYCYKNSLNGSTNTVCLNKGHGRRLQIHGLI